MRIFLAAFLLVFLFVSLGCGTGIHPIGDDELPNKLLPQTLPSTGSSTRNDETDVLATSSTDEFGLVDPTSISTTGSSSIQLFNQGNATGASQAPQGFTPIFSSFQKVSNMNDSVSLNGNVADKMLSDRVHDALVVVLDSFASQLFQSTGALAPTSISATTTTGGSYTLFSSSTSTSTSPASTSTSTTSFSSTSTTSGGSTTSTASTSTTSSTSAGAGLSSDIPPSLFIRALLAAATATTATSTPAVTPLSKARSTLAQWHVTLENDLLILNDDAGLSLEFHKCTRVGSETAALGSYHSDGKILLEWAPLDAEARGFVVYGLKADLATDGAGVITSLRVTGDKTLNLTGQGLYAPFSLNLQGLTLLADSGAGLLSIVCDAELKGALSESTSTLDFLCTGLVGELRFQEGQETKANLSFSKDIQLNLTGLFVPEAIQDLVPGLLRGAAITGGGLKLTAHQPAFTSLAGFTYENLDLDLWLKLGTASRLFGRDPVRGLTLKSSSPLKFVDDDLAHPLQGTLLAVIELLDGQKNQFTLVASGGSFGFDGRVRAPDGSEFEVTPGSIETLVTGQVRFADGMRLDSILAFPRSRGEKILAAHSGFFSQMNTKEIEIEATLDSTGLVRGNWIAYKPIFRQGEFLTDPANEDAILVRDGNGIGLATFNR